MSKQRRRPYLQIKTITRSSLTIRCKLIQQRKNRTVYLLHNGVNWYNHANNWAQELVDTGRMSHNLLKPGIIRNGEYAI